jgi:hypothetical protein
MLIAARAALLVRVMHLLGLLRKTRQTLTTVILDVVSVPVLSLQMVVALPMVSQALKCRTRF